MNLHNRLQLQTHSFNLIQFYCKIIKNKFEIKDKSKMTT